MRTPRLPEVDRTEAPADLNELVRSPKDEILFLRVCHHISKAVYHTVEQKSATPFYNKASTVISVKQWNFPADLYI